MGAETNSVIITAAGEGSRIRSHMTGDLGLPDDYPKHLLPTGGASGETLIGRIIRQAENGPNLGTPIVNVREAGMKYMETHPDVPPVEFDLERFRFSMDPLYYRLRRTGNRVMGCAGDLYSEFSWEAFIEDHETHGAAMSLLVSKTTDPVEAAVFDIDHESGTINGLRRPTQSSYGDYTNVGVYIIDPTEPLLEVLDTYLPEDPADAQPNDTVFSQILNGGLARGVQLEGRHVNINTLNEYRDLQAYTGMLSVSAFQN